MEAAAHHWLSDHHPLSHSLLNLEDKSLSVLIQWSDTSEIEVRIDRLHAPRGGSAIKKSQRSKLLPGQIIVKDDAYCVVEESLSWASLVQFKDGMEFPQIAMKYAYMTRGKKFKLPYWSDSLTRYLADQVERLLIVQCRPDSSHKFRILPKLDMLPSRNFDRYADPFSPTRSMTVLQMDTFAYAELKAVDIKDLTIVELEELARTHQGLLGSQQLAPQQVNECAKLQLDIEVIARL